MMGEKSLVQRVFSLVRGLNDRSLGLFIFFVTSRCNARCAHCFYWKNLNKTKEDLTLGEIAKMVRSMPPFSQVLFSGGEPFLRKDLVDIIKLFYRYTRTRVFSIPTNGTLPERILAVVEEVLRSCPEAMFSVNFSIDGLGDYHDRRRGVPGCFEKVMKSIGALRHLRNHYPSRLEIKTNTVISSDNLDEVRSLISFFKKQGNALNDCLFEVLRGDPKDSRLKKKLSPKDLDKVFRQVRRLRFFLLCQAHTSFWTRLLKLANLRLVQNIQRAGYFGRGWGVPCLAGQTAMVVDHNGNFRHCELRAPVVNLRRLGMDFTTALASPQSIQEGQSIARARCWQECTHLCFIYYSIFKSYKTYLLFVPLALVQTFIEFFAFYYVR